MLVDPNERAASSSAPTSASRPYRFTARRPASSSATSPIDGGINLNDRSEFYVPWVMNQANPNQLFLGTYRLYRTDNAEAPSGGDVHLGRDQP